MRNVILCWLYDNIEIKTRDFQVEQYGIRILINHVAVEKFPIDFSEIRLKRVCATILQPFE